MRITANQIIAAVGNSNLTFKKIGQHHYCFEYSNGAANIYMQRKEVHVSTLSQFSLEKWADMGKTFAATFEGK